MADDVAGGASYAPVYCRKCGEILAMMDQFTLEVNSAQAYGSVHVTLRGPNAGQVAIRCRRCRRVRVIQAVDIAQPV
jgi:predicted RNA-binding Zn-ribbon protein involved in translation (DUF1610 family)